MKKKNESEKKNETERHNREENQISTMSEKPTAKHTIMA